MEIKKEAGILYIRDSEGHRMGEITYVDHGDHWLADHTFVRPAYRNRGIAAKLLEAMAEEARARGVKINPLCSYVVKQFNQNPAYADVDLRVSKRKS